MAKPDRSIVDPAGVVFGKKVYKPGMEDELFDVIHPESARQLIERNVLSGDWNGSGMATEEKAEKAAAPKK